jgi:hypothetical protein
MMEKLISRKLVLVVVTVLLAIANKKLDLGLDDETMNRIIAAVAAYLVGQGIADHGAQGKKAETTVPGVPIEGPNWDNTSKADAEDEKVIMG